MSQVIHFGRIIVLTTMKDIRIAMKYLPNFVSSFVQLAIRILFFLLLAGVATFDGQVALSDDRLFLFFASAILIWFFSNESLYGALHSVNNDLYNGTLEYIYYLPVQKYAYFLGTTLSRILVNMVYFIPTLVFLGIYYGISWINCLHIVGVCLLVCFSLVNLGIWMSSLGLIWKKVEAVVGIITLLFDFLAGAFVPVSEYPGILQYASYLLPQTWGYDLIRHYAIGESWTTLHPPIVGYLSIACLGIFFFIMAIYSLRRAEMICKRRGFNLI